MNVTLHAIVDIDHQSPLALDPDDSNLLEHGSDLSKLLHRLHTATFRGLLLREAYDVIEKTESESLGLIGGRGSQVGDSSLDLLADLVVCREVIGSRRRKMEKVDGTVKEAEEFKVETRSRDDGSDERLDERTGKERSDGGDVGKLN